MTYQELLDQLKKMNQSQLQKDVTVYDIDNEEYYEIHKEIAFTEIGTPIIYL